MLLDQLPLPGLDIVHVVKLCLFLLLLRQLFVLFFRLSVLRLGLFWLLGFLDWRNIIGFSLFWLLGFLNWLNWERIGARGRSWHDDGRETCGCISLLD